MRIYSLLRLQHTFMQMFNRNAIPSSVLAALSADSSSVRKSARVGSAASLISFLVILCFAVAPRCDANDKEADRLIDQGYHLDHDGKVDEAISCYKKAMAIEPRNDMAIFDLGNEYLKEHDYATARIYIQKAIDLNPHEARYWDRLGVACGHLNEVDEAIRCYKKATALEPRNDMAIFDLGSACLDKHDDATAKSYLQKAINLNPHEARYWNNLGLACENLKDLKSAEAAFKRAVSIEPTCGRLCNLAAIYKETGRLKESRETVLRAKSFPEAKTPEFSNELQNDLEWLDKQLSDKKTAEH